MCIIQRFHFFFQCNEHLFLQNFTFNSNQRSKHTLLVNLNRMLIFSHWEGNVLDAASVLIYDNVNMPYHWSQLKWTFSLGVKTGPNWFSGLGKSSFPCLGIWQSGLRLFGRPGERIIFLLLMLLYLIHKYGNGINHFLRWTVVLCVP